MSKVRIDKKAGKSNLKQKSNLGKNEFFMFLRKREQKRELISFLVLYGILFILIRYAYPYPDTFVDTGNYVLCAENMEIGGYRPFGYSWFLNIQPLSWFFGEVCPDGYFR